MHGRWQAVEGQPIFSNAAYVASTNRLYHFERTYNGPFNTNTNTNRFLYLRPEEGRLEVGQLHPAPWVLGSKLRAIERSVSSGRCRHPARDSSVSVAAPLRGRTLINSSHKCYRRPHTKKIARLSSAPRHRKRNNPRKHKHKTLRASLALEHRARTRKPRKLVAL